MRTMYHLRWINMATWNSCLQQPPSWTKLGRWYSSRNKAEKKRLFFLTSITWKHLNELKLISILKWVIYLYKYISFYCKSFLFPSAPAEMFRLTTVTGRKILNLLSYKSILYSLKMNKLAAKASRFKEWNGNKIDRQQLKIHLAEEVNWIPEAADVSKMEKVPLIWYYENTELKYRIFEALLFIRLYTSVFDKL